jgi:RNA polymerase sigma factor (sigma-70 family)
MEQWQSGDMNAFEALFHEYERAVFKNAYLITGSREDAEDVLQEVFTSVWRSRHTFDPNKGKLSTWLHRITVNECLKKRRKEKQRPLTLDGIDLQSDKDSRDEELQQLDHEHLTEALNTLDARHRAVLVLRYFDDLSYQEIALTLGVPLGTVKSRINHALKLLRVRLGDE